jgi:hypothetical protein
VVLYHRRLRSLIARSQALGLSSQQKAAIEGLNKALEEEMHRTLKRIDFLSR